MATFTWHLSQALLADDVYPFLGWVVVMGLSKETGDVCWKPSGEPGHQKQIILSKCFQLSHRIGGGDRSGSSVCVRESVQVGMWVGLSQRWLDFYINLSGEGFLSVNVVTSTPSAGSPLLRP